MSRIPFWLVIVFALILCSAAGVTLLHRAGLLGTVASPQLAADQPLADATGLLLSGASRRTGGGLLLTGRAAPGATLSLVRDGAVLATATADATGGFTLGSPLYDARGWLPLQIMAEGRTPVPLVVNMAQGKAALGVMQKQPDGGWTAVTLPDALAIAAISELPDGRWQIFGQQPAQLSGQLSGRADTDRRLLIQLYSDDALIETAKPKGRTFTLNLPQAARPQRELRLDIYDADSLQPIIRLSVPLPPDKMFTRIAGPIVGQSAPVWIWKDATAQQADPADLIAGQIVPVAVTEPVAAPAN